MSADDKNAEGVSKEPLFEVSVLAGVTTSPRYKTVGQIITCVNRSDQRRDFREIGLYLQSLSPPLRKPPQPNPEKKCEKQKMDCSNLHGFLKPGK